MCIPHISPHTLYFLPDAIDIECRDHFYSLGETKLASKRDNLPFQPLLGVITWDTVQFHIQLVITHKTLETQR